MNSYIEILKLNNYRVYDSNEFKFLPNINIIYGKNGIGKTNILEAISFLSPGKGFLNANLNEILKINTDNKSKEWTIYTKIKNNDIIDSVSIFSEHENNTIKKKIKINNNSIKNQEELTKIFNLIWLTPDMQNLFNGDKTDRRKFLDRTVFLSDSQHASRIAKYEFFVKERINVLSDDCKFDKNWLNVLEQRIAEVGISIAVARNDITRHLNKILQKHDFNFPKFTITIDGGIENMLLDNITSIEAENRFRKILFENREQDKFSKRTNEGVHKSDLRIFYHNKNIDAQYCSTGEQKLFLISLTILKALFCKEFKRATPIILLDEVFSYLDKTKKIDLFNELSKLNVQVFITGTDIKIFDTIINDKNDINLINLEKIQK